MTNKRYLPTWFFLGIITMLFAVRLFPNRTLIFQPFNVPETEALYQHSQFATKDPWFVIQDWELYPYAGYIYLTTGDLSRVNIEHPPLGKYLYGLAVFLVGRPGLVAALLAYLWLLATFFFARNILASPWLALGITLTLTLEPLFLIQATHPLLDLPFALACMAFLWFAAQKKQALPRFLTLGVLLGIVAGIKFPAGALILGASYLLLFFWQKRKVSRPIGVFLLAALTYLAFYLPLVIQQGFTGLEQVHQKAIKLHLSHLPAYPPLAPLRVMIFNQWPVWWDANQPIHSTQEWTPVWPLLAIAILTAPLFWKKIRQASALLPLTMVFTLLYFLFLNSRLFFPGYLTSLLPFSYIFLVWEIKTLVTLVPKIRQPRKSPPLRNK